MNISLSKELTKVTEEMFSSNTKQVLSSAKGRIFQSIHTNVSIYALEMRLAQVVALALGIFALYHLQQQALEYLLPIGLSVITVIATHLELNKCMKSVNFLAVDSNIELFANEVIIEAKKDKTLIPTLVIKKMKTMGINPKVV